MLFLSGNHVYLAVSLLVWFPGLGPSKVPSLPLRKGVRDPEPYIHDQGQRVQAQGMLLSSVASTNSKGPRASKGCHFLSVASTNSEGDCSWLNQSPGGAYSAFSLPLCLMFFLSVSQKGLLCLHPFCPTCVLPGARQWHREVFFSTGPTPEGRWSGNYVRLFSVTSFQSAVLRRLSYFLEKYQFDLKICSSVSLQSGV